MKANLTNLRKALKACAKAHNARFCDWSGEGQLGVHSVTPAAVCDVQMIMDAFYGRHDMVEISWGYVVIWLEEMMVRNKREVDETLLKMALPYGTEI